jgi:hypothetical protein
MRKESQSFKLWKLFRGGKVVTLSQMAKRLKVDRGAVSSYVGELARVYGARIEHVSRTAEWRMTNTIEVPPDGTTGRKMLGAKVGKRKATRTTRSKK